MHWISILLLFRNPIIIPPYMQAKNLSCVNGSNLSNISINTEKLIVPTVDLKKNSFPSL